MVPNLPDLPEEATGPSDGEVAGVLEKTSMHLELVQERLSNCLALSKVLRMGRSDVDPLVAAHKLVREVTTVRKELRELGVSLRRLRDPNSAGASMLEAVFGDEDHFEYHVNRSDGIEGISFRRLKTLKDIVSNGRCSLVSLEALVSVGDSDEGEGHSARATTPRNARTSQINLGKEKVDTPRNGISRER